MSVAKDEKGQLHTIEGLAAAFIIIIVLATVVQTTSVTPLSASFTNQHVKLELQNMGNDLLSTLDQTKLVNNSSPAVPSQLKTSLVDWSVYSYYDTFTWNNTTYVSTTNASYAPLNTPLSSALAYAFADNGVAFNVEVGFPDQSGHVHTSKMIWNGDPSENSVTVSRLVVLHDDSDIPIGSMYDDYYIIPDISPDTGLHSVVAVKLTMWVM